MGDRLFTDYEIAWFRAFWPRYTRNQTHRMFNERFGRSLTRQQIYSAATNHKCGHSAFNGRFQKGSTPPNKGRKGYHPPGSEKGWFAKGEDPFNTRPLYSERVDHIQESDRKTPVLMIKIPGPAPYPSQQKTGAHQKTRWIRKAVWVWENDHGPVPDGHVILQLDGDYANCAPANLECVPRSVLARLNDYPSVKPAGPDSNPARVRIARSATPWPNTAATAPAAQRHLTPLPHPIPPPAPRGPPMKPLTPEQKLDIARRVHRTFEKPSDWFQGGWGRDNDGIALSFHQGLHILDEHADARPPALAIRQPESRRCFCLAAAIRIHTGAITSLDPANC